MLNAANVGSDKRPDQPIKIKIDYVFFWLIISLVDPTSYAVPSEFLISQFMYVRTAGLFRPDTLRF